jgi:hypothetical protein
MANNTIGLSRPHLFGRLAGAATTIAVLAALLGIDGQLAPLCAFVLRREIALAVLALIAAYAAAGSGRRRIVVWTGVFAALALLSRAPSVPFALVGTVLALSAVEIGATWTASAAGHSVSEKHQPSATLAFPIGLVRSCLTYVALRFAVDLVPQVGMIAEAIADAASRYNEYVRGAETRLSSAALGGPSILLAVLFLLWCYRGAGGFARLVVAASLPIAWFASLAAVTPDPSAGPLVTFWRGSLHGLIWLASAIAACVLLETRAVLGGKCKRGSVGAFPSRVLGGSRRRRLFLAAACLAAGLAGVCLTGTALLGPAVGRTILVHNRGGLDWDRPVFGQFGVFSGGMFGILPVYCRAEGYDFDIIDKDTIEPSDLKKAQILVLINSQKIWEERERRAVLDFVARGGSLLVLGDHTDVFGLMRGFNSLLGPLGIRFRFDSAYKARDTWRGCQSAAPDAIAWGWDEENPGVAVGASLELSGSARPLLVGRYGFSDNGVRENTMGSFLGNYHYDKGERLGDVVLVATTTYERGRVVVWGDTSAFQGVSTYYPSVVGPMLAWLSRPAAWTERPPVRIAAALGLLAAILWLWIVRGTVFETAIIAAGLLIGLIVP